MNPIKRHMQILWKRNRFWLLLIILFMILASAQTIRYNSKDFERYIHSNNIEDRIYTSETYVWNEEDHRKFEEELTNRLKSPLTEADIQFFLQNLYNQYLADTKGSPGEILSYEDFEKEYLSSGYSGSYDYYNEYFIKSDAGHYYLDGSVILYNGLFVGLNFFALMAAIFLTSLEHITPFYTFKRTLPWKEETKYVAGYLTGFLLLLLATLLGVGLGYGILVSLNGGGAISFVHMPEKILTLFIMVTLYYTIAFAMGKISGSFIGHIGMILTALFGVQVLFALLEWSVDLFTLGRAERMIQNVYSDLPSQVKVFLSPGEFYFNGFEGMKISLIYPVLVGILYFLLGLLFVRLENPERTGMMLLHPAISKGIGALAVYCLAALGTFILGSGIFAEAHNVGSIFIFLFLLFVFTKIVNILFKVRIKV